LLEEAVREFKCETEVEKVKELARNCLASSVISAARNADNVYHEMNFAYPYDGKLIEGVIDLVYVIDDRLYIADYKSDAVSAKDAPARADGYKAQMASYAAALGDITGMEVVEVSLLFAAVPEVIKLDVAELYNEFEQVRL